MAKNESGIGYLVAGIAIGAAIGATAALLTAPQSGEETRKIIKTKSGELSKESLDFFNNKSQEAVEKLNSFIDENEFTRNGKDKVLSILSKKQNSDAEFSDEVDTIISSVTE